MLGECSYVIAFFFAEVIPLAFPKWFGREEVGRLLVVNAHGWISFVVLTLH